MLDYFKNYFKQPGLAKKVVVMLKGIVLMGFFLSFLIPIDLGTDPCTFMNVTISERLGILFGTWQLLLNLVLIIIVIFTEYKYIGPGTIANMVLIGYVADFFRWVWSKTLPESCFTDMPLRAVIFVITLAGFIVSAALYMNSDVGLSPYDAIPKILHDRLLSKIPFKFVRMAYDFLVIIIGCIFGGKPNIGIILMALALGPVISFVGKHMGKILNIEA
ncbi:MAG: hypothetical protein K6A23_03335 [Butyrivibrio sp.]|nr:hypothetical protein [Butyrivibrio sp.]